MVSIDFPLYYTWAKPYIHIYTLGDFHVGGYCAEKELKKDITKILDDPFGYAVLMGDYGEFIAPDDPRFDPDFRETQVPWFNMTDIGESTENKVVDLLKSIKSKIVGMLYGNHEESFRTHKYGDVHQHICTKLGVMNLGFLASVRFICHRKNSSSTRTIKGLFTHGISGARTSQGKKKALSDFMDMFPNFDFYAYAHTHIIDNVEKVDLDVGCTNKVEQRIRHGVLTGCYFKTYGNKARASYGERKLYPANRIGSPMIKLNCITGETEPEVIGEI